MKGISGTRHYDKQGLFHKWPRPAWAATHFPGTGQEPGVASLKIEDQVNCQAEPRQAGKNPDHLPAAQGDPDKISLNKNLFIINPFNWPSGSF